MEFKRVKKGYDPKQVEDYVIRISKQYEDTCAKQMERIELLKAQNDDLGARVAEADEKRDNINAALTSAINKAKQIEYASKIRFAIEGERLKAFEQSWTSHCAKEAAGGDKLGEFCKNARKELLAMMSERLDIGEYVNEAQEDFYDEKQRLEALTQEA